MDQEIDLVAFSNTVINRCGLTCEVTCDLLKSDDAISFKEKFVDPRGGLMLEMVKLSPVGLCNIIMHGIGPSDTHSFYRLTAVSKFSKTGSVTIAWTGKNGRDQMIHMAKYVVIACMFDILRAEWWIGQIESGTVSERKIPFKSRPAMNRFVQRNRIDPRRFRPSQTIAE